MWSLSRFGLAIVLAVISLSVRPAPAQTQSSGQGTEVQIYEKFRAWVTKLSPEARQSPDPVEDQYRKVLAGEGLSPAEIDRHIRVINEQGQKLEIERWNRILTAPKPMFNTKPNAFLVEMTHGISTGKALDVGMGQGRNALYLAQQGWTVTGFDPADKAVAVAQEEAKRLGVSLTALVLRDDQFDFGKEQWDLIVLSYVGARGMVPRVYDALKPGGLVVVEGFHRDATKTASIGGAVVFDTNELLKLFERFRVIRYEDTDGTGDFGMTKTRLVRLCAQRP
jgi:2-polyprenyl-3-methyl-5-hydroxy-6-metoxy-1,4-benzoquinol methylase